MGIENKDILSLPKGFLDTSALEKPLMDMFYTLSDIQCQDELEHE